MDDLETRSSLDLPRKKSPVRRGLAAWLMNIMLSRLIYGLAVLLLVGLVASLMADEQFRLEKAEIAGTRLLSPTSIAGLVQAQGQNIFLARKSDVVEQMLAQKVLQSVTVKFKMPNLVQVEVEERKPVYIWKVHPTLYLVSADGIVLGTTEVEDKPTILVDVDNQPVEVGDRVDLPALKTAAQLSVWLPRLVGIRPHYFEYSRRLGVVLPHPAGFRLAFGWQDRLEDRVASLSTILDTIEKRNASPILVDLRFAGHYYFR